MLHPTDMDLLNEVEAMPEPQNFRFEKKGDSLAGIVTKIMTREGKYGPYQMIEVQTKKGEFFQTGIFTTALIGKIEGCHLKVGDALKIIYKGWVPKKNSEDGEYKDWVVSHISANGRQPEIDDPEQDPF